MSRIFTPYGQSISIPASPIFNGLTELTLAAWIKPASYTGAPIIVKDPNFYSTTLFLEPDGTLFGAAGGTEVVGGYVDGLAIKAGDGGSGYAANDSGTLVGGDGNAKTRVALVDGAGKILDLNGVTGSGGSGYVTGNDYLILNGGAQPGVGVGGIGHVLSTTTHDNFADALSVQKVPLGIWSHVAMTWKAADGRVHLYINGVELAYSQTSISHTLDPSPGGYVFGADPFGENFDGAIADGAIYNRAFSDAEIYELASSTTGPTGTPIGAWHLCGLHSPEPDISGNGNDGVLSSPSPATGGSSASAQSPGYSGCFPAPAPAAIVPTSGRTAAIRVVIDGEGSPIAAQPWGNISIPYACTITGWALIADQPGNVVMDVKRVAFGDFPNIATIVGSEPPNLVAAIKNENLSVATWQKAVNAGDVIHVDINSCDTCQRLSLTINITIP